MADIARVIDSLYVGSASFKWEEIWEHFEAVFSLISPSPRAIATPNPDLYGTKLWVIWPIDDSEKMPDLDELADLTKLASYYVSRGKNTLIHCGAGLNRSGLMAALVLKELDDKLTGQEAIDLVRAARGPLALSNPWFERYLRSL